MTDAATDCATPRTRLQRFASRGRHDRATIDAILDAALLCHIGYVRDGQPFVTPTSFWRIDDTLYWHGSSESSMLRTVSGGLPVCFTVSHVDGLVLSRVMSRHAFNYRSVVVLGTAHMVTDPAEKRRGMRAFVDRILPGRWTDDVVPVTPTELKRITIVRLDLHEASAKLRGGPPTDDRLHHSRRRAWAGHVPFKLAVGRAVPDPHLAGDIPLPDYIKTLARRFDAQDLADSDLVMPPFATPPAPGPDAASQHFAVERVDTGEKLRIADNETILTAFVEAGMTYPYGCAAGGCGTCKTRLLTGRVDMLPYEPAALPDDERGSGLILACRARPTTDLTISLRWRPPPVTEKPKEPS